MFRGVHILTQVQNAVLERLGFLTEMGFYLGGGTALAIQLGHRTSLDFDFYTPTPFSEEEVKAMLLQRFPGVTTLDNPIKNTIDGVVDGVSLSGFYYPYPLVEKLVEFGSMRLIGIKDIAAMKVVAIIQRARQRDFFDLYYLLKEMSLPEMMAALYKKYPWYEENNQVVFRSLIYFEEAENDDEAGRVIVFDKGITWEVVKERLSTEVHQYVAKQTS